MKGKADSTLWLFPNASTQQLPYWRKLNNWHDPHMCTLCTSNPTLNDTNLQAMCQSAGVHFIYEHEDDDFRIQIKILVARQTF